MEADTEEEERVVKAGEMSVKVQHKRKEVKSTLTVLLKRYPKMKKNVLSQPKTENNIEEAT